MKRTYKELISYGSFEDRFNYLKLHGVVGESTFGYSRFLNQEIYRSREWKTLRNDIIIRDEGNDLGVEGYEIYNKIIIHHINPITLDELKDGNLDSIFDPNNLICVSFDTHQAIHFGDESLLPNLPIERKPGDTKLW